MCNQFGMKNKYWLKMYVKDNVIDNVFFKFDRLGEGKLFGYILSTMNVNDCTWTYDKYKGTAIMQLCGIKEASIFNYLKLLCNKGILKKMGKGIYLVESEYIGFGNKSK